MGMTAFVIEGLIKLNDSGFKKSLSDAENNAKSWGEKLSGVGEKVGHGLAVAGKAAAAAAGAAAVAIGKLSMDAVNAYSEYEQLVGGVETLFGTSAKNLKEYFNQVGIDGSSSAKEVSAAMDKYNSLVQAEQTVMDNAHKAFVTAGMDANTYMQTVTSFSASLLQGLGGDTLKAAQVSDMAIQDMSDNANKMGSDMQSIQNAYQGFAKQNYTMLDNLKLGYGGTKQEMQRLLKDAQKLTGVKYDINNLADVYAAIHAIQEEMGITGTTAEEAASTIQGSTSMMKAAWMNLKIAMVDPNGNIGQAIKDMTDSIKIAAKNWIPAIKQALTGIGEVITELAPVLSAELPGLINELLPGILQGAVTLVTALAQGIIDNIGLIIDAASQILDGLIDAFKNSDSPVLQTLGKALEGIKAVITWIISAFEDFDGAVQTLEESDNPVLQTLGGALKTVKEAIASIAYFFNNFDTIVKNLQESDNPVLSTIGGILDTIKGVIEAIITAFESGFGAAVKKLEESDNPVLSAIGTALDTVKQAIASIAYFFNNFDTVVKNLEQSDNPVLQTIGGILETMKGVIDAIITAFSSGFQEAISKLEESDNPVLQAIGESLEAIKGVIDTIKTFFESGFAAAKAKLQQSNNPVLQALASSMQTVENVINAVSTAIEAVIGWLDKLFGYNGKVVNVGVKIFTGENGEAPHSTEEVIANGAEWVSHATTNPLSALVGLFQAKGDWIVPYDNYPSLLHKDEMVLTASQARRYRDGEGGEYNLEALTEAVSAGIRMGMAGAQVNSYLDGKAVTDEVSRILGANLSARRFA